MNPDIELLHSYPFEKLRGLFAQSTPNPSVENIALSIGEPKHPAPDFVKAKLTQEIDQLAKYPSTKGIIELRSTISEWLNRRFHLTSPGTTTSQGINSESQVLPVNGTREALFAFAQAVVDRSKKPTVMMPNPFYQIYEGAALLAGAEPVYLECTQDNGFIPDYEAITSSQWQRCQLLFICSPGNPSGAVTPASTLQKLVELAVKYDFIIASDECYSEIYFDEDNPPVGLLQACKELGNDSYKSCVVFHSLSKRSNLPGLRSGFVAGDAKILQSFFKYRTYHGCAMPIHHQLASIAAWNDETHVQQNREQYRQKFSAAITALDGTLNTVKPDAGFYLWPSTPIDDTLFARKLFEQQNVTVLPGQYLGRTINGYNPGQNKIRLALVAPLNECIEACRRINSVVASL